MRKKRALEKKMEAMPVRGVIVIKTELDRMDAHNWAKKFKYQIRTRRRFDGLRLIGFEIERVK